MSSASQAHRRSKSTKWHLWRWSWQYWHFLLFERNTQMWRGLLVRRFVQRTHIRFVKSICEDALRSCTSVKENERTLREVMINRSTVEKWLADALLAKSIVRNWCLIISTCESLFTFSRRIHYQISQQTNDISVLSTFHHLVTRTLHAVETNDITFFTLLRQQSSDNIFQMSSSQKISVTRSVI
jgi:hypothetical protein